MNAPTCSGAATSDSGVFAMGDWYVWLASLWEQGVRHNYSIKSSADRHWKSLKQCLGSDEWSCTSLRQARDRYSWNDLSFKETLGALEIHAAALQSAIRTGNSAACLHACRDILVWGGVNIPPTSMWLDCLNQHGTLPATLQRGLSELRQGKSAPFDGSTLLMNSATTKLFSLADEQSELAIVDGRVGAALGMLAARFCETRGLTSVPEPLAFLWGDSRQTADKRLRNPSSDKFKFKKLRSGTHQDLHHAEMVINVSEQLGQVTKLVEGTTIRDWEAALFMIGYDLTGAAAV